MGKTESWNSYSQKYSSLTDKVHYHAWPLCAIENLLHTFYRVHFYCFSTQFQTHPVFIAADAHFNKNAFRKNSESFFFSLSRVHNIDIFNNSLYKATKSYQTAAVSRSQQSWLHVCANERMSNKLGQPNGSWNIIDCIVFDTNFVLPSNISSKKSHIMHAIRPDKRMKMTQL